MHVGGAHTAILAAPAGASRHRSPRRAFVPGERFMSRHRAGQQLVPPQVVVLDHDAVEDGDVGIEADRTYHRCSFGQPGRAHTSIGLSLRYTTTNECLPLAHTP